MNNYEAKQEARRERLERAAEKAQAASDHAYQRSHQAVAGIPMGQPILVGHHSEGRHRNALKRSDNAMRKSIEEGKRAGELAAKAAAVGSGGISSDDPDAPAKIAEKIERLERDQARMKAANAAIRKHKKAGPEAQAKAVEEATGIPASAAAKLLAPDFAGRVGFPDYALTNNGANIRRLKGRLAQVERLAAQREEAPAIETETAGVRMVENREENRLQLIFPGKPSFEVRKALKSAGFRWSPTNSAWQRHLGNSAKWGAERILEKIEKGELK